MIPAVIVLSLALASCTQKPDRVAVTRYTDDQLQSGLGRHTVHAGETVWTIAQAYHVEVRDVLDANALSAPFVVREGARIVIPAPREYTVRKGDTVFRVSRMFGTTTTKLAEMNNIKPPYSVEAGQVLKLPVFSGELNKAKEIVHESKPLQAVAAIAPVERHKLEVPSPSRSPIMPTTFAGPAKKGDVADPLHFIAPVQGHIITRFGPTQDGLHNDGINIKAPKGAGVKAAERGQVVYTGNHIEGYGQMILVKHSNGYVSAYAHLDKSLVKKGDMVTRGQTIGTVGTSGHVNTPQLHFELRKGRDVLDPQKIVGGYA